jgi:hypothetical protein
MLKVVFQIIKSLLLLCSPFYLLSAAMRPLSFCTSFLVYGGCIWMIALILSGLASIPLVDTKQPNTLPLVTPKMHFSGLNLRCASCILEKVSDRSEMYGSFFLPVTTMSFNVAFIILQNMGLALRSPSGIHI